MPRSYARPIKEASQPVGNYYFYLSIYLLKKIKIKNVFEWIFMKGRISIYADTTASLEKEHIDK